MVISKFYHNSFRDFGATGVDIWQFSLLWPLCFKIGLSVARIVLIKTALLIVPDVEIPFLTRRPASADRTARADNFRRDLEAT